MMGLFKRRSKAKVKGCVNDECKVSRKKTTYKKNVDCCSKCGDALVYVCKQCYKQLPDDSENYCVRCLADMQDQIERTKSKAKKTVVGTFFFSIFLFRNKILGFGKSVLSAILKFK
jgi:predicted amidophosphoribosyltransferase